MNRRRAIVVCALSGLVGACCWCWASARAGEEQEEGQRVLIKAWILDVSSLKPGEPPYIKGLGGIQTRLGRQTGKTGLMDVGGQSDQSWAYSVNTHDATFPTRTEVQCEYSVEDGEGTIVGQMTLDEGQLDATLSEDGKYLLLLQIVGL